MRTLTLNLDLSDAEILRDAVANHLGRHPERPEPAPADLHTQSLRATLHELSQMIERPSPRQRAPVRSIACDAVPFPSRLS